MGTRPTGLRGWNKCCPPRACLCSVLGTDHCLPQWAFLMFSWVSHMKTLSTHLRNMPKKRSEGNGVKGPVFGSNQLLFTTHQTPRGKAGAPCEWRSHGRAWVGSTVGLLIHSGYGGLMTGQGDILLWVLSTLSESQREEAMRVDFRTQPMGGGRKSALCQDKTPKPSLQQCRVPTLGGLGKGTLE